MHLEHQTSSRHQKLFSILLPSVVLIVTFFVFSPALQNGFVNWEDDVNVTENPYIRELNADNLRNIFTQTITGGYRPLPTLTYAIEYQLFRLNPLGYHLSNILLHLLATGLFYLLLRKLGANLFIACLATLLFGIHPMRVESVVWITERKDVLYSSLFLLSIILYIYWLQKKRLLFYLLALAVFIMALLSKIQAVALPIILIGLDYYHHKELKFRHLWNKIPFLILALATGIFGIYILQNQGTLIVSSSIPFWQRIFIGTYTLCVYLAKAVFPWQLSAIYPNPASLTFPFYLSAAVVILLFFLAWRFGRSHKAFVFGTLFFLMNIVFVLQILGAGQAFEADRFTYLAYGGLFFLFAIGIHKSLKKIFKPLIIGLLAGYLVLLGVMTWNRVKVWRTSETLFTDVLQKYPDCSIAHNNLGLWYRDQNRNREAVESYTRAIRANPSGYMSYSNRGESWFALGETKKALTDLNIALKINPDYSKALSNRGAVHGSLGENQKAITDLDRAIELNPYQTEAYQNRALVHYALGDFKKAAEDCTAYLQISPDDPDILNYRGRCYDRLNRNEEALNDFNRAIAIHSTKGHYYRNRSYLLAKVGDFAGALRDIRKAQELGTRINPDYLKMLEIW
ncbi:MAG: tetratricopeptide repeat protein [Bacteroidales bacterium]|nr:tetratricopeptide repeat protein [Bacteroidales bacterium]